MNYDKKQFYEESLSSAARRLLNARNPIKELKYIRSVDLKGIRDAILDLNVSEEDTILLNPIDFDNLIIEYRRFYGVEMPQPYQLLKVYIQEDNNNSVPSGRIGIERKEVE